MAKKIKVQQGFVLMRHPDPAASASWGGQSYEPVDGYIVVPVEAVADMSSHGFIADGTDADQAPIAAAPEPAPEAVPVPEPATEPEPPAAAPEPAPEA